MLELTYQIANILYNTLVSKKNPTKTSITSSFTIKASLKKVISQTIEKHIEL